MFRNECTGTAWELDAAHNFVLKSLMYKGEIRELRERRERLIHEAQERGDVFGEANFGTYVMAMVKLARDEADDAEQELHEAMEPWKNTDGSHSALQRLRRAGADPSVPGRRLGGLAGGGYGLGEGSNAETLLRIQHYRIDLRQLRARAALAVAPLAAPARRFPAAGAGTTPGS